MKVLKAVNMKRCIGCYSCSLACARTIHKSLSWKRSGIRIHSSGGISTGYEATVCLACDPPPCASVCPTQALKPRKGGGILLKQKLCIHCGECAEACPVDAIYFDPQIFLPVFCIHCGSCVPFCPHDCLEMAEPSKESGNEQ
jgi:Fe-S-cluster-containing hydrogenase component 2